MSCVPCFLFTDTRSTVRDPTCQGVLGLVLIVVRLLQRAGTLALVVALAVVLPLYLAPSVLSGG